MVPISVGLKVRTHIVHPLPKLPGLHRQLGKPISVRQRLRATLVSTRERIGKGPWKNVKGEVIAATVEDLHSDKNNLTKATVVTEKGEPVSGRGDAVNMHDILTGSDPNGMYSTAGGDTTCGNWSKNGDGSAIVGHHDRAGLKVTRHMTSWNSSHGSAGCSPDALKKTGGNGLFYCFVAN